MEICWNKTTILLDIATEEGFLYSSTAGNIAAILYMPEMISSAFELIHYLLTSLLRGALDWGYIWLAIVIWIDRPVQSVYKVFIAMLTKCSLDVMSFAVAPHCSNGRLQRQRMAAINSAARVLPRDNIAAAGAVWWTRSGGWTGLGRPNVTLCWRDSELLYC